MALETPDRIRASGVLLIQNFQDPPNATIDFLANNGFASAAFVDPTHVETTAIVLGMDDPVSNNEGEVETGGDASAGVSEVEGYITPNHYLQGSVLLDALEAFQVVVTGYDPGALNEVFRLTVSVMKTTASDLSDEVVAAIAGEPLVAPV